MEMGETTAEADEKILQPFVGGPRHLVASRRTRGVVSSGAYQLNQE